MEMGEETSFEDIQYNYVTPQGIVSLKVSCKKSFCHSSVNTYIELARAYSGRNIIVRAMSA